MNQQKIFNVCHYLDSLWAWEWPAHIPGAQQEKAGP